jgi:hypothetical protein
VADFIGFDGTGHKFGGDVYTPDLSTYPVDEFEVVTRNFRDAIEAGSVVRFLSSAMPMVDFGGAGLEMFSQELFHKIIVTPRAINAHFVLSRQEYTVNVWNSYVMTPRNLTAISITGPGGAFIQEVVSFPLLFAGFQSRDYTLVIPADGDPNIATDIVFEFLTDSGTDVLVTGSRLVPFDFDPDWDGGFGDRMDFLTEVLTGWNSKEQRIQLRKFPRQVMAFRVFITERLAAQFFRALMWNWQAKVFGVPFWPDAQHLTTPVTTGDTSIIVDTTRRRFVVGSLAMLVRGPNQSEVQTIAEVHGDHLVLVSPLQSDWAADGRTVIVPAMAARMTVGKEVQVTYPTSELNEAELEFTSATTATRAIGVTPTQYNGHDVLELEPNVVTDPQDSMARNVFQLDPLNGDIKVFDRSGVPIVTHSSVEVLLEGRAEIDAFLDFRELRKGKAKPFWIPTWQHDFTLENTITDVAAGMVIKWIGYTRFMFDNLARRYVAFLFSDGTRIYRKIIGATDGGATESITLDSALGRAVAPGDCVISFLCFVRASNDGIQLEWDTTGVAGAVLQVVELPKEVPS